MIMVCEECDPKKLYRYDGVENIIIQIPALGLSKNETITWKIKEYKCCNQQFNEPIYHNEK